MAKVTSKLQVTIPKKVADEFGIAPGDQIDFVPSGDGLRVVLGGESSARLTLAERLELFDRTTSRQRARQKHGRRSPAPADRGWKREELYGRGRAR